MKSILFGCMLSMMFATCSQPTNENAINITDSTNTSNNSDTKYQCPMDCENGKSYSDTGSCPVCEMNLEIIK